MQMPAVGRRIALIGGGELGPEEKRLHGYVGAYIAKNPDLVAFVTREAAREMVEAARYGILGR